jgi:hypothetical protein
MSSPFSLKPLDHQRVETLGAFTKNVREVRGGDLGFLVLSGHDPGVSAIPASWNIDPLEAKPVSSRQLKRLDTEVIDTATGGLFSNLIETVGRLPLGTIFSQRPSTDFQAHVDPTTLIPSDNKPAVGLWYAARNGCDAYGAQLQGEEADIINICGLDTAVEASKPLEETFDTTATEAFELRQGDFVAFASSGRYVVDTFRRPWKNDRRRLVVRPLMHKFVSSNGPRTSVVISGIA